MTAQLTMVLPSVSPEIAAKDAALRDHANGKNGPILKWLREQIRRRWPDEWVTADHARVIMREYGIQLTSNNALGALFRTPEWHTDGARVPSLTKGSHGNLLLRWRYTPLTE